jgi:hypothetical protein
MPLITFWSKCLGITMDGLASSFLYAADYSGMWVLIRKLGKANGSEVGKWEK